MQKKSTLKYGICFFACILLSMTGCNKFKGDQEVPAYIRIDTITITPESAAYFGFTPTANITDAWIAINGWSIGGYQLPATIPVLERGEQKVLIQAGIRTNNLSLRRGIYPFYSGVEFTVNFVEDSIINVTFKEDSTMQTAVAIRALNKYVFTEDFERWNHGFDTVSSSGSVPLKTELCSTVPAPTPKRLYEEHVGRIHLTKDNSCCCIMTKETFTGETALPYNQPIFVEIDYLTNNIFEVGIINLANNKSTFHSVVVVGSQRNTEWSRIYVDISSPVTAQLAEDNRTPFKIFIRADLEENNSEANIYLDNIRLVF